MVQAAVIAERQVGEIMVGVADDGHSSRMSLRWRQQVYGDWARGHTGILVNSDHKQNKIQNYFVWLHTESVDDIWACLVHHKYGS